MTYSPLIAPSDRPTIDVDASSVPACSACGETLAPDGTCLEIGACLNADTTAARRSHAGATLKHRIPSAWNARGRVD